RCSDDAIFSISTEGVIQSWNDAAERIYGYCATEIIGTSVGKFSSSDREHEAREILEEWKLGVEVKNLELVRKRKNGQQILIQLTISPIRDLAGKVLGAVTISRDITEKRRFEAAQQDSMNKYRALFEDSGNAIWLVDEENVLNCNSAARQMFGYDGGPSIPKPYDMSSPNQFDGTSSETAAKQKIAAALLSGKERFEWLHQRRNGEVFPTEVCLTALSLSGRRVLLATVRDITERRHAEDPRLLLQQTNTGG
ncbi:MAG: PAS domain-containing protein, partial [Terracidiphilus sp.]